MSFLKTFTLLITFFHVTSQVSKTYAFLCAHYAICKYMFTVGLKCNSRKITARFSAGRCKQLVFSVMLLFRCSWFKYWFIKLNLVTVGKCCCNFSHVLDGIVDYVNVNPSTRALKTIACVMCRMRAFINFRTSKHLQCNSKSQSESLEAIKTLTIQPYKYTLCLLFHA